MPMECIDKTGHPRSDDDLRDAIGVIEKQMVLNVTKIPPELLVLLPTMREGLKELIGIRQTIERIKKKIDIKPVFVTTDLKVSNGERNNL